MSTQPIDCACVIHSDKYHWQYVDRLYSMLTRHLSSEIRMHVWTEPHRKVLKPYIRHDLIDWPGITGPRKSWWYKLQMFDPAHDIPGPLLYLDLDVVLVKDISWITRLPLDKFWAAKDFRYLWRSDRQEINSSIMYWSPSNYHWIWQDWCSRDRNQTVKTFAGDQDYLNAVIPRDQIGFLDSSRVVSYRWQVKDGGWNNKTRTYISPGTGSHVSNDTSVIVFHGDPKPAAVEDSYIRDHWR